MMACSTRSRGAVLEHVTDFTDPLYGSYSLLHRRGQFNFEFENGTSVPDEKHTLTNATPENSWLAASLLEFSDDATIISHWVGARALPSPPAAGSYSRVLNHSVNLLISPEAGESIGDPITVYMDLLHNITALDPPGNINGPTASVEATIEHLSDNSLDRVLTSSPGAIGLHGSGIEIPMQIGDQIQLELESITTTPFTDGGTTAFDVAFQVAMTDIPLPPPEGMLPPPLVPEPSSLGLAVVAAVTLFGYGWRRRRMR